MCKQYSRRNRLPLLQTGTCLLLLCLSGSITRSQPSHSQQEGSLSFQPVAAFQKNPKRPLNCAVVRWNKGPEKPVLTLICPPEEVFAPLRVVFGLSWSQPTDIPPQVGNVTLSPGDLVRFRLDSKDAHVLVPVRRAVDRQTERGWLRFTAVVQVGLVTEP